MRRELLYTVAFLGVLFAWSSNVAAQPLDGYARVPPAQPYPSYYLPPPSYILLPSYVPALGYSVPTNFHTLRPYRGTLYDAYYNAPAHGYIPPPAAEYVPPIAVLIPLGPRSCGSIGIGTANTVPMHNTNGPSLDPDGDRTTGLE